MKLQFGKAANDSIGLPSWALGTSEPVRVLLIDDDDEEASLTKSMLAKVHDIRYELEWVSTFGDGLAAIGRNQHDAYLVDENLGILSGTELVREAREAGSLAALVMMTGQGQRSTDVGAMKAGATSFLTKGQTDVARLDQTLRYAINHSRALAALDRSQNRVAGLEELGQILVDNGPRPEVMARIVEMIAERFGFPRVAIYLANAEGDALELAGQRGHERPVRNLRLSDSGVQRVTSARKPMFVPSLSSEGDLGGADHGVATELAVPLLVAGQVVGLLNIASLVATPIGEEDFAAARLIADRLAAALALVHERRFAEVQLRKARQALTKPQLSNDGETSAYRRSLLDPLIVMAIALSGAENAWNPGLLLIACDDTKAGSIRRLDALVRTAFADQPRVRFGDTELAVLTTRTSDEGARSQAKALTASAQEAGMETWCGYAAWAAGTTAAELITAAEVSLAYARRSGPGAVIG
jgi:FixJ family two-component response regulator